MRGRVGAAASVDGMPEAWQASASTNPHLPPARTADRIGEWRKVGYAACFWR
jgi:hypothetical protein